MYESFSLDQLLLSLFLDFLDISADMLQIDVGIKITFDA
jgi:hypothetical protein